MPASRQNLGRWLPYLLSLPLVGYVAVFFLYPIVRMGVTTLLGGEVPAGGADFGPFERIFADEFAREIIYRTLRVAVLATLLSLVLAYPLTLWMRQLSPRWRGLLAVLMLSPLLMSVVVRTLGWVIILGPIGLVSHLFSVIGLDAPSILYKEPAIVLGLTHVFLGFMVLSLLTSVLKVPDSVVSAAFNLGANSWQAFRHVVWPMSLPGVIAGVAIVFPLSAGAYVIPALLGGSRNPTMGTQVYQQAIVQLRFDRGAAMSLVLFGVIAIVLAILGLAARSRKGVAS